MALEKKNLERSHLIARKHEEITEKEFNKLKDQLRSEYESKKKGLIKGHDERLKEERDKIKKHVENVNIKRLVFEEQVLRRKYANEKKNLLQKLLLKKQDLRKSNLIARKRNRFVEAELNKLKEKLRKDYDLKKENAVKDYNKRLEDEKNKLRTHFKEEIIASRVLLNNKIHEHLTNEVKNLNKKYKSKEESASKEVEEIKKRVNQERGALSKIRNALSFKARKIRQDDVAYKRDLLKKLEKEKNDEVKKAIEQQSKIMKQKLKNEFDEKLRQELELKERELERKKANLTMEIQKKAKLLFS